MLAIPVRGTAAGRYADASAQWFRRLVLCAGAGAAVGWGCRRHRMTPSPGPAAGSWPPATGYIGGKSLTLVDPANASRRRSPRVRR